MRKLSQLTNNFRLSCKLLNYKSVIVLRCALTFAPIAPYSNRPFGRRGQQGYTHRRVVYWTNSKCYKKFVICRVAVTVRDPMDPMDQRRNETKNETQEIDARKGWAEERNKLKDTDT